MNDTKPRFHVTYCSQCGGEFGPGDSGFSHCSDHQASRAMTPEKMAALRSMVDKSWDDQLTHAYAEGRADERDAVDWAEDCARVLLKLKDTLAERGARPTTPEKAAMWDEAWRVYERMVKWANPSPAT